MEMRGKRYFGYGGPPQIPPHSGRKSKNFPPKTAFFAQKTLFLATTKINGTGGYRVFEPFPNSMSVT